MQVKLSNNFRHNVRRTLKHRGITESQFRIDAGLGSITHFSNVMNGKAIPTLDYCERVATALGVTISKLLENPKIIAKSA
jgi:transcriptional regulator with XRE-family HTH domain